MSTLQNSSQICISSETLNLAANVNKETTDLNVNRSQEVDFCLNGKPFLPKLPQKVVRLKSSRIINDLYLNADLDKNNRESKLNKNKKVYFNGDLLKTTQVLLVLNSNMSETLKRIKSSDTPWIKTNPEKAAKPSKSSIMKNRVKTGSFMRSSISENELRNISSSQNDFNDKEKSHLRLSLMRTSTGLYNDSTFNKKQFSQPYKIKRFAQDLLSDHVNKAIQKAELSSNLKPDVVLHALDTIWELHSVVLHKSPVLKELYEKELNESKAPINPKLELSKKHLKLTIGAEYFEQMTHLYLEIDDKSINKHSFAIALGNLYHFDVEDVPDFLIGGVLASAHLLVCHELKEAALKKLPLFISNKTIIDFYTTAVKYQENDLIVTCERWLEINLIADLGNTIQLRKLPVELLTKIIQSKRLFTFNEYNILNTILNWLFLNLNPQVEQIPPESIMWTFFTSLAKDVCLVDKYPALKDALYSVRLLGISNTNHLTTIQKLNVYPSAYMAKIMMEIQQSNTHGGDMLISRSFETYAIRQGFSFDTTQNYYSEQLALYGFYFDLVAEKCFDFETRTNKFKFFMERLNINDTSLSYEQTQLDIFSLRNDRFCVYSINVYYWHNGEQVCLSTGKRNQRFGKRHLQKSQVFEIELPGNADEEQSESNECFDQLYVLFSLVFPPN